MTMPPEVKRYHTSRDEGILRQQTAAPRPQTPGPQTPGIEVARRGESAPRLLRAPGKDAGQPDAGQGGQARHRPAAGSAPKPAAAAAQAAKAPEPAGPAAGDLVFGNSEDGFGDLNLFDKPVADQPAAADAGAGADLAAATAAVREENISARRLRIAERIAALHQITATSPEEAVALLRQRGIDPFEREALRRAVADEGARANARPARNVPSVVDRPDGTPPARRKQAPVPGPARQPGAVPGSIMTEDHRAQEIFRIQRDIAKRRRKRLGLLLARLSAFVFIPSIVAGWYYFTQATPLYATFSQFQIQQASSSGGLGGLGSLFSGTQMATNPESVAVQSYLTSRDAMLRLDADMGFKRAFQDPSIDPLTRLDPDATNEAAYSTYKSSVKIGYDPTEGVINMEVIAPDPQLSRAFSLALINYAEEQVDQMTARLRSDQMMEARANYEATAAQVLEAQRRVQELQQQMGVLDPIAEGGAVMGRISVMEGELLQKRLELGTLQSNARPNASRVDALRGEIDRIEAMIAETRLQLTESTSARNSLAVVTGELRMAEAELATRQQLLASALAELEAARIEVGKQVRYLTLSVAPIAPDEATYPRTVQNTFVAFLIFSGIYLMISLTASILREQVTS